MFAPICTAPVFDTGGCTAVVSATTDDYSTTANVQNSYTAKIMLTDTYTWWIGKLYLHTSVSMYER